MKTSSLIVRIAEKNKGVSLKTLRESIDLLDRLADLGVSKGPDYKIASPYSEGLRGAEPNKDNPDRQLKFERS